MGYLELNGWTIPLNLGDRTQPAVVGLSKVRGATAALLSTGRAFKRAWRVRSSIMSLFDATALIGMLSGLGDSWSFDTDSAQYSAKSSPPEASPAPVYTIRDQTAADDANVPGETQQEDSADGGALYVDEASENFSAVGDTDGDAANWQKVGATAVDADAVNFWIGAGSVKVTHADIGPALDLVERTLDAAPAQSTQHVVSGYIKLLDAGIGDSKVEVRLLDDVSTGTYVDVTLVLNEWVRFEDMVHTTNVAAAALDIAIRENVAGSEMVYAVDGLCLEKRALSTSFMAAAATRATGAFSADVDVLKPQPVGFTFACWAKGSRGTGDRTLFEVGAVLGQASAESDGVNMAKIWEDGSNLKVVVHGEENGGASITTVLLPDASWSHVALVFRRTAADGYTWAYFLDGVEITGRTVSSSDTVVPEDWTRIDVGHSDSAEQWSAGIDEVVMYPYPATEEQIAGLFDIGDAAGRIANMPAIRAAGDFVGDIDPLTVEAVVGNIDIIESQGPRTASDTSTSWRTTSQRVSFELLESTED